MFDKIFISLLVLGCVRVQAQSTNTVKFAIYYAPGCPACKYFITHQLYPTYQKYQDYLILDLVPYGFIKRTLVDGKLQFTSKYGGEEACYATKIQACALGLNAPVNQTMDFIYCLENSGTPASLNTVQQCADDAGMDDQQIIDCAQGDEGSELLAKNGEKTDALDPHNTCIPWYLFNGVYNATLYKKAYTQFEEVILDLLNC